MVAEGSTTRNNELFLLFLFFNIKDLIKRLILNELSVDWKINVIIGIDLVCNSKRVHVRTITVQLVCLNWKPHTVFLRIIWTAREILCSRRFSTFLLSIHLHRDPQRVMHAAQQWRYLLKVQTYLWTKTEGSSLMIILPLHSWVKDMLKQANTNF